MESFIIIILAIILIIFISLNYYKSQNTITSITTSKNISRNPSKNPIIIPPSCAQTRFGCCTNGIDSKINFHGTNCPGYIPEHHPTHSLPTHPHHPTHPTHPPHSLPPPPHSLPPPPHPIYIVPKPLPIGGCEGTKYGCCSDNLSAKFNTAGTNCVNKKTH